MHAAHKHGLRLWLGLALTLTGALACASTDGPPPMPGGDLATTESLYGDHCAACHGTYGQGDGSMAGYLGTRPRDFRGENFRFVSSAAGGVASTDDLMQFILRGSRTSHMPAHRQLDTAQLRALASYVRELRRMGVEGEVIESFLDEGEEPDPDEVREIVADRMDPGERIDVPRRPASYVTDSLRGASLFAEHCASCHGSGGRGDGTETLRDELGRTMRARDLTRGEYRGGGGDMDLYLRIRCGLPGTPMSALGTGIAGDEEIWQIIDHVRLLALRH